MAKVISFETGKVIENTSNQIQLNPRDSLQFSELFKRKLAENPDADHERKFQLWQDLANQTWLWPKMPVWLQRASFEQELILIRQEGKEG